MKIIALLLFVVHAHCIPTEHGSSRQFGFFDAILAVPSRICACKCGVPDSGKRSLDIFEDEQPGRSSKSMGQSKLLDGDVLTTHKLPWNILVMVKGQIVAGGVIISKKHVVTSASPISGESVYDVKVRVAVHDRCAGDITSSNMSVEAIEIHPAYSPASRAHNVALLRLAITLNFDSPRLQPICMPNSRTDYAGEMATVVSWLAPSSASAPGTARCEPHFIEQRLLSRDDCSKSVTSSNFLTDDKMCIGAVGSKSLLCGGDVGAPIQYKTSGGRYELVGVLSDENVCDQTNGTLFTKMSDHLSWITDKTDKDCLCRI